MRTGTRSHLTAALVVALGVAVCAGSWLVADRVYHTGALKTGYWIGLLGTAFPAMAIGGTVLRLRRLGTPPEAAAPLAWLRPLLVFSLLVLGLMAIFPLL